MTTHPTSGDISPHDFYTKTPEEIIKMLKHIEDELNNKGDD